MLCDRLEGWDGEGGRETQEGGDMGMCVCIADSLCCRAEANTPLWSGYAPIKMLKKKKECIMKKVGPK